MTEEKKLTDEEYIERLEYCQYPMNCCICKYQNDCFLDNGKTVDLIHRLQDENELLKQEKQLAYDTVKGYSLTDIEQKAEIERLTEEINQRREMMRRMDCNYATELQKNAELQKQVNELKAENTELYKEHTTLIAGSILAKQNIAKDTAKEILQEGKYCLSKSLQEWIKERFGLEENNES